MDKLLEHKQSLGLSGHSLSSLEYVLCCDELSFIVAPKRSRIHVVVVRHHHHQQQQRSLVSSVLVSRVISTIRPRAERKLNRQSQMKPIILKWCAFDVDDLLLVDLSEPNSRIETPNDRETQERTEQQLN